MSVRENFSGP